MKHNSATPYVAAVIMFEQDGKFAHLLRQNTPWMSNFYGLPGGKVEKDESAIDAAVRETKEEVGVTIDTKDLTLCLTLHRKSDDSSWVDFIFKAEKWEGELYNAEPHKHKELKWFAPDKLPKNIIPVTKFYFESIASGKRFRDYGFKEPSMM